MRKIVIFFLIIVWGCGPEPIPEPEAVVLIAPENLNICTTASRVNEIERQVRFQWTAALNTESYNLVVQNTFTGDQRVINTSLLMGSIILLSGAPYQWYVISTSSLSKAEGKSPIWQFYLEGDPDTSHFPFPAILLSPQENEIVNLDANNGFLFEWDGNDLDDDITSYDLYIGDDSTQLNLKGEKIKSTLFNVILKSDNEYYWQIITHDKAQNQSKSSIFRFQTN